MADAASKPLPHRIAVLCDLRDEQGRVLLLRRTRPPNQGLYSPIGGKLHTEVGESPAQCAQREIREEAGVEIPLSDLRLAGVVSERGYEGEGHWLMFIYRATRPVAVAPGPIDEGVLEWKPLEDIPRLPIPRTDREIIWPLLLRQQGRFFAAHIDCTSDELRWRLEQAD